MLLRWPPWQSGTSESPADPVVKVGDWIADVTYERSPESVNSRFLQLAATPTRPFSGLQNPFNNGEWDNLPAQRCFWYQVQKVTPAQADPYHGRPWLPLDDRLRRTRRWRRRTLLDRQRQSRFTMNAALIAPSVVNVIPQTIFAR